MDRATPVLSLKIKQSTFLGLQWGCVVVALAFVLFRGYVRLKVFRRLSADDGLVVFAWILLLVNTILWQATAGTLYFYKYQLPLGAPPPSNFLFELQTELHSLAVIIFFNGCGLWAVKLSFLLFFRKLGHNVERQRYLWWCVLAATIVGFIVYAIFSNWDCTAISVAIIISSKCNSDSASASQRMGIRIQAGCDVATDGLILILPFNLLWKVQMRTRQKIELLGIFSLTLFVMINAVIAVVVPIAEGRGIDDSWLFLWRAIEQTFSIVIICLISYRSLFHKDSVTTRKYSATKSPFVSRQSRHGNSLGTKPRGNKDPFPYARNDSSSQSYVDPEVVPMKAIHVRRDYTVLPGEKGDSEQV